MRRNLRTLFVIGGKMSRREVTEISCDRCSKVETLAPNEKVSQEPVVIVQYYGHKVQYNDLCRSCRKAMDNYILKGVLKGKTGEAGKAEAPAVQSDDKKGVVSKFRG